MKIRAGFVSNSSSSSYIIVYKSLKDFDMFKDFKEGARLLKSITADTIGGKKRALMQMVLNFLYDDFDSRLNLEGPTASFEDSDAFVSFWELLHLLAIPFESYLQIFKLFSDVQDKYFQPLKTKYPRLIEKLEMSNDSWCRCTNEDEAKDIQEAINSCREVIYSTDFVNKVDALVDTFTEEINNKLREKKLKLHACTYSDYSEEGSDMCDFIEWITKYPKSKFNIIQYVDH